MAAEMYLGYRAARRSVLSGQVTCSRQFLTSSAFPVKGLAERLGTGVVGRVARREGSIDGWPAGATRSAGASWARSAWPRRGQLPWLGITPTGLLVLW